jgi:hypothetical protein
MILGLRKLPELVPGLLAAPLMNEIKGTLKSRWNLILWRFLCTGALQTEAKEKITPNIAKAFPIDDFIRDHPSTLIRELQRRF